MDVSKVRNLKWVPVADWSELPKTWLGKDGKYYVCEYDVDSFVDNIFRDVARKLDISYEKVDSIFREENQSFEETKERLFSTCCYAGENAESLKSLKKMLRVPEVEQNNVEKILNDFLILTDIEKLEVLQRLGLTCIKIECLGVGES